MRRADTTPVLLIHGGLAEVIGATQFWTEPGIVAGLAGAGLDVVAPDRNTTPPSWPAAASDAAQVLTEPTTIVAASNGVSVALRLALDHAGVVAGLVLLWPATGNDEAIDTRVPESARHLLVGDTIRGVTDGELEQIQIPVAIMASEPENRFHQHRTVDRMLELIGRSTRITPGFPESVHPEFAGRIQEFLEVVHPHLAPTSRR